MLVFGGCGVCVAGCVLQTGRPHPSPAALNCLQFSSHLEGEGFFRLCEHSGSIVTSVQLSVFRFARVEKQTKEVLPKAFPFEGEGGALAPDEGGWSVSSIMQ